METYMYVLIGIWLFSSYFLGKRLGKGLIGNYVYEDRVEAFLYKAYCLILGATFSFVGAVIAVGFSIIIISFYVEIAYILSGSLFAWFCYLICKKIFNKKA